MRNLLTASALALLVLSTHCASSADESQDGSADVQSSLTAGTRLSGKVIWMVVANDNVATVEFWADNQKLGTVTGAPFTYVLDTTRMTDGTHHLGLAVIAKNGSRTTPQIGEVTIANSGTAAADAGSSADASAPLPPLPPSPAPSGAIDFRADFETGDGSQFSGFECPHFATQFQVESSVVRQGRYAGRFQVSPGDVWSGNDTVRCLAARYDTGETTGDDRYFGLSVRIPSGYFDTNLIWELHHPASLYNLASCGVAPFAIHAHDGGLHFRIATGDCNVGSGWRTWMPNIVIPGLETIPRDTWIDFIVHIKFAESATGHVQLWYRTGSAGWSSTPALDYANLPTMPYSSTTGVHNAHLYTEMGLYTGSSTTGGTSVVFLDGYRRGSTFDAVKAEFPAP